MSAIDLKRIIDVSVQPLAEVLVGVITGSLAEAATRLVLQKVIKQDPKDNPIIGILISAFANGTVMYIASRYAFGNIMDPTTGFFVYNLVHFANQPTFIASLMHLNTMIDTQVDKALDLPPSSYAKLFT